MNATETSALNRLAALVRRRNALEREITAIIERPALVGHVGEYIASVIFDIRLEESATTAGYDGRFSSGPLAGQTVNVKTYPKLENILDINMEHPPDWYLALTGPKSKELTSKGSTRPWIIVQAFLFDALALIQRLANRGVQLGVATSVISAEWDAARIFPLSPAAPLTLSEEQLSLLALFADTDA